MLTNLRPIRLILLLLFLVSLLVWLAFVRQDYLHGTDFYPLYFAARKLLLGQSSYGAQATHELVQFWDSPWAHAGVAYPLPFILLMVPFTFFAFPVASLLWTAIGAVISYACVILARGQSELQRLPPARQLVYKSLALFLPLTFWPFYDSVRLSQATLLWFGITVILVLAIQRKNGWITAICVVLLALKPQTSLLFALYGLYWLWRNHKGGLKLALLFGSLLLAVTVGLQPDWIGAWLAQMKVYSSIVNLVPLLPLGLLIIFIATRFPMIWWAKLAIIQVVLFPLTGIYSLLPLLLAWCAFSPPLALLGTSISLLWALLSLPKTDGMIWVFILLPLLAAILWQARPARLRSSLKQGAPIQEPVIQGTP